jgi:hypothetical protein
VKETIHKGHVHKELVHKGKVRQGQARDLTLGALFLALAVLFPILFHAAGLGSVFLPMYWPVAAAGFFLPLWPAVSVGMLAPLLSFLLTGMPPVSPPILHIMAAELFCLAGCTSLLHRRTRLGLFWIVLIALASSRAVQFLAARILAPFFGLPADWISIASVLSGLPGAAAILVLVPPAAGRLLGLSLWNFRRPDGRNA